MPAGTSALLAQPYDRVRYPSGAFPHTHPERLWTVAHLHGLAPPALATARVLELGGGDGLNAMAMAVGLPGATFRSIDIAAEPVRAGQALAASAGLHNVQIELGDVADLADAIEGEYDYVIAHGLYAWVPDEVRRAVMRVIGRTLAPDGVALVSYNAEPGGRIRGILRDLALAEIDPTLPAAERPAAVVAALTRYGAATDEATPLVRALRDHAARLAARGPAILAHDELEPFSAPQTVTAVLAAAAADGLAYLDDARIVDLDESFPDPAPADLARFLQRIDYQAFRFFRTSLFVRAERPPCRRFDPARLRQLWLSANIARTADGRFAWPGGTVAVDDPALAMALDRAIAAAPFRLAIAELALDTDRLAALGDLYAREAIGLHGMQLPGVPMSDRPCASPLARAQVRAGADRIARLSGDLVLLDQPSREALLLLDGRHDLAGLAKAGAALPQMVSELGRLSLLVE